MSTKKERLEVICRVLRTEAIGSQDELLKQLEQRGFSVTQSTLSRDIRKLKVIKVHDKEGNYAYRLPEYASSLQLKPSPSMRVEVEKAQLNVEFSGNLAVVHTRPGYAMGIASDIDTQSPYEILATIAGDDTILVIPREGISRDEVVHALAQFL
ncbi:MAG: arginine repressor [Parabacteroides sp.]